MEMLLGGSHLLHDRSATKPGCWPPGRKKTWQQVSKTIAYCPRGTASDKSRKDRGNICSLTAKHLQYDASWQL